jgi:hypothetical protein
LPVAVVTIVARIWGTLLEKSHRLAVENPMEQSLSLEAYWFSGSQEIPCSEENNQQNALINSSVNLLMSDHSNMFRLPS